MFRQQGVHKLCCSSASMPLDLVLLSSFFFQLLTSYYSAVCGGRSFFIFDTPLVRSDVLLCSKSCFTVLLEDHLFSLSRCSILTAFSCVIWKKSWTGMKMMDVVRGFFLRLFSFCFETFSRTVAPFLDKSSRRITLRSNRTTLTIYNSFIDILLPL